MAKNEKLYDKAIKDAKDRAGGERAFWIIGSTLRKGLVAAAILTIIAHQDESIPAETVRELTLSLYDRLIDDEDLDF